LADQTSTVYYYTYVAITIQQKASTAYDRLFYSVKRERHDVYLGTTRRFWIAVDPGLQPFPLTTLLDLSIIPTHAHALGFESRVNPEFFPYRVDNDDGPIGAIP
jgi:hypothetical protein